MKSNIVPTTWTFEIGDTYIIIAFADGNGNTYYFASKRGWGAMRTGDFIMVSNDNDESAKFVVDFAMELSKKLPLNKDDDDDQQLKLWEVIDALYTDFTHDEFLSLLTDAVEEVNKRIGAAKDL